MNWATSFTVICLVPLSVINFFNALKKKIARPVHYRILCAHQNFSWRRIDGLHSWQRLYVHLYVLVRERKEKLFRVFSPKSFASWPIRAFSLSFLISRYWSSSYRSSSCHTLMGTWYWKFKGCRLSSYKWPRVIFNTSSFSHQIMTTDTCCRRVLLSLRWLRLRSFDGVKHWLQSSSYGPNRPLPSNLLTRPPMPMVFYIL